MLKDKRKSKEIIAIDLFRLVDTAVQFKKSHRDDVVKIEYKSNQLNIFATFKTPHTKLH